jgi:putative chitinase
MLEVAQTIDWNNPNFKISKYFTVKEVTQGDNRRIPKTQTVKNNIIVLARELDTIRELWGSPIEVTSWYRPPAINRAVGGVPNSQHILGSAVDVYPFNKDIFQFQTFLHKNWKGALGYGARKGFVHLDLRGYFGDSKIADLRWNYA